MHLLALLLHAHVLDCGATLLGSKLICLAADLVHTGPSLPRRPHIAPCRTLRMWLPCAQSTLGQTWCIGTSAVSTQRCVKTVVRRAVSSFSCWRHQKLRRGCLDSKAAQTDAEASAARLSGESIDLAQCRVC